jgi:hypothetical protein
MATTVGQHAVSTFTTPAASAALASSVVRGNFNTQRDAYVDHDADTGIHLQSSLLADRPAYGTAGRKWLTTDAGSCKLWHDTGSAWDEVDYVNATGTATVEALSVTGNTTLGDATTDTITLTARFVSALIPLADNLRDLGTAILRWKDAYFSGTVTATTVTATTLNGAVDAANLTGTAAAINGSAITALNASNVSSGTLNNSRLPAAVSVTTVGTSGAMTAAGGFVQTGGYSYEQITTSSGNGTVTIDASLTNWHKHTMTGNVTTFTISNMVAGQKLCLELVNQSTYTFAWGSIQNPSGMTVAPTSNKSNYYEIVYGGNTQTIVMASLNIGNPL